MSSKVTATVGALLALVATVTVAQAGAATADPVGSASASPPAAPSSGAAEAQTRLRGSFAWRASFTHGTDSREWTVRDMSGHTNIWVREVTPCADVRVILYRWNGILWSEQGRNQRGCGASDNIWATGPGHYKFRVERVKSGSEVTATGTAYYPS